VVKYLAAADIIGGRRSEQTQIGAQVVSGLHRLQIPCPASAQGRNCWVNAPNTCPLK
jgi:hypothetical protein